LQHRRCPRFLRELAVDGFVGPGRSRAVRAEAAGLLHSAQDVGVAEPQAVARDERGLDDARRAAAHGLDRGGDALLARGPLDAGYFRDVDDVEAFSALRFHEPRFVLGAALPQDVEHGSSSSGFSRSPRATESSSAILRRQARKFERSVAASTSVVPSIFMT
jgi:hypothetical protein